MRTLVASLVLSLFAATVTLAQDKPADKPADKPTSPPPTANGEKDKSADTPGKPSAEPTGPLDFTMKDIDGGDVALATKYKGKVVVIVNVASKCGLTPQYAKLQELHEKYAAKGLAVLAFPCNDFGGQEPAAEAEIKKFCQDRFHVGFDLFSKVAVKGDKACELYKYLTSEKRGEKLAGEIKWNFTKFLIGRDGKPIARFEPRTTPDDPKVIAAIEAALGDGAKETP